MKIDIIRERVQSGHYLTRSHAILHALKEGFERKHIVEAVLTGKVIETYPDDERILICGRTTLSKNYTIYLHLVCEYADPIYVEFVTAYIPDELQWENPPFRRRRRRRR
ncbi:MAG: DUF4258 domain-containing protein [Planctomycetes bacterium]|nr:DUF4258 domain-containing protein [Planctomycetota bacterium]